MTTSPSSGLSAEAKEFIPLVQNSTTSIPLYVDENTVASIYPSDQQPLMVQTIYPMMITNPKVAAENVQFPEIEFHIQPSQQQQFHIDSCNNLQQQQQQASTNGNSSTNNTSQIVLLPTTNPTTGYYPAPQIIYSPNEPLSSFYPMEYCEQPLINFSLQQPTSITKSNRISSQQQQQQRPTSFRQQHGTYRPSTRGNGSSGGGGGNRGNGNPNNNNNNNRNPYYDYNNRRNCSSYTQNSGRGNSSNSKRISSSYHQHDYNNYYHSSSSSTRSRGYLSRSSQQQQQQPQQHDEYRKEHFDYYNNEKDFYENDYQQSTHMNDDGTPFEFRPEDFPSLPINNPQSDKTPSQSTISTNTKPTSSWNAIVSAPRPHSTSPHSLPQSQDSRSDRSRSFNNKLNSNTERKSLNKKPILQTPSSQPSNRASKINSQEDQQQQHSQSLTNPIDLPINENKDDGFIQTKQQHRRLKRKNKIKEDISINESNFYILDDENAFPILGQNKKSENDSNTELIQKSNTKSSYQITLNDMFNELSTSTQIKDGENSFQKINSIDLKREQIKSHKPTKLKRIINKELEDNQKQKPKLILSSDEKNIQNETDTNTANAIEDFCKSVSCTDESDNDDEIEPTSQDGTPFCKESNIKQQIHNSNFREYCSQLIDHQLDDLCMEFLLILKNLQDRKKKQLNKKRFVHGIREVTKNLNLNNLKCVFIAPDCQSIESQGGLNDAIENIIYLCKKQIIPYIFTLNRQKLGQCLDKTTYISTIGVFDYSGIEDIYQKILNRTNENQQAYKQIINYEDSIYNQQEQNHYHIINTIPNEFLSKYLPKIPSHYGHSRQTSDTSIIYLDPQLIKSMKKQHIRASSGTFEINKTIKKNHQRTLSDGAKIDTNLQIKYYHSRTPSSSSVISQIEQYEYFEQSKNILINNNYEDIYFDNDENRLKSIHEDTEENLGNNKKRHLEKWIYNN